MEDQELTKAQLEKEMSALRREVVELESLKAERDAAIQALQESEARYKTMAAGLEQKVEDPGEEAGIERGVDVGTHLGLRLRTRERGDAGAFGGSCLDYLDQVLGGPADNVLVLAFLRCVP